MGSACRTLESSGPPLWPLYPPGPREIVVVRTTRDNGERLSLRQPLHLETDVRPQAKAATLVIDPSVRYQKLLGFGGSFTEASAEVFHQLDHGKQEQVLHACFNPETGLGYKLGRLHMNSCDFSAGNWSCCDEEDLGLSSFSIERYEQHILPMVHRAAEIAGKPLWLLASPWSPPAWMKDTGQMCRGGKLLRQCRHAWAKHYVLFAQAMESEGAPLAAFTVQNEPEATTPWENCFFSAEEERDFVRDFLGPALEAAGLKDLRIIVHDHNRDTLFLRARTIFSDPAAARFIWGVAFHWYGDPRFEWWPDPAGQACFENVRRVHELRPETHIIMSEACQEMGPKLGDWKLGERYAESIIKDLNNWTEGWIDWNLLLNLEGGPNHTGNHCSAPIIADLENDELIFQSSFFYMGHFSRHIQSGAERILCASTRDALEATAFANPDGTLAIVVMNQTDTHIKFWLDIAGYACARTSAPAHSITTYMLHAEDALPSRL